MQYDYEAWKSRIAARSDFTTSLVHLTRSNGNLKALDVLMKILSDKRLVGSSTASGFIVGDRTAVCFQEAPLYSLTQNIYTEQMYRKADTAAKVRYIGIGVQFSKRYVFQKSGRPVIYDKTAVAKEYLPKDQWWRIVNFDLSNEAAIIDWCHEREWRVPSDFDFSLDETTVLLPSGEAYRAFVSKCLDTGNDTILKSLKGIVQLGAVFY